MNAPRVAQLLRELADAIEATPAGPAPVKRRARRARPVTPRPEPDIDPIVRAQANAIARRLGIPTE